MRTTRIVFLATFALALPWTAPARDLAPLLNGDFVFGENFVPCTITADGTTFTALGGVNDIFLDVGFRAQQPTSATRSATKLALKQSQSVELTLSQFSFGSGSTTLFQGALPGCSASLSYNGNNQRGVGSLSCKGDDFSAEIGDDLVGAFQTIAQDNKHLKFKVDAMHHKWSLSIQCGGPLLTT
jgi:hypothetical protein